MGFKRSFPAILATLAMAIPSAGLAALSEKKSLPEDQAKTAKPSNSSQDELPEGFHITKLRNGRWWVLNMPKGFSPADQDRAIEIFLEMGKNQKWGLPVKKFLKIEGRFCPVQEATLHDAGNAYFEYQKKLKELKLEEEMNEKTIAKGKLFYALYDFSFSLEAKLSEENIEARKNLRALVDRVLPTEQGDLSRGKILRQREALYQILARFEPSKTAVEEERLSRLADRMLDPSVNERALKEFMIDLGEDFQKLAEIHDDPVYICLCDAEKCNEIVENIKEVDPQRRGFLDQEKVNRIFRIQAVWLLPKKSQKKLLAEMRKPYEEKEKSLRRSIKNRIQQFKKRILQPHKKEKSKPQIKPFSKGTGVYSQIEADSQKVV